MTQSSGAEARIRLVYPKPEQPIYESATFLLGSVEGWADGNTLRVNGEPVPVTGEGFFAMQVPVHPGMNPVKLEVLFPDDNRPRAQELFALYGAPPLEALPSVPLAVHADTLQPAGDIWLSREDQLTVAVSASEGAEVLLEIPGLLESPMPLRPLDAEGRDYLDNRETVFAQLHQTRARIPVRGYYQASIPTAVLFEASGNRTVEDWPLVLHLRQGDQSLSQPMPGRLSLLKAPRTALVTADRAVTRTAPENGARLTPQRAGTAIFVDGLQNGWARVRLSRDETFWLPFEALAFQPEQAAPPRPGALEMIEASALDDSTARVRLVFSGVHSGAPPIRIDNLPGGQAGRLQIRCYGVRSHCDFIRYAPDGSGVRFIHWRQVAEKMVEVGIDPARPLAGYDYAWEDNAWVLRIKTLPTEKSKTRVLIDPGHGGAETGATGLDGLPEKDLNLRIAELLRDALVAEGFGVAMTRTTDADVPLTARSEQVARDNADIVLSIHHNALPDGRDPLAHRGACTFYYHPFEKSLAQAVLAGLTTGSGGRFNVPNHGLFYDSLHMTRIHQAVSILVEVGFFTHPEEYAQLIDPAFQAEAARRMTRAVSQWWEQGQKA